MLILVSTLALACTEETTPPPAATYEAVEEIIVGRCATNAASCHGGEGEGSGRLNFGRLLAAGAPLTDAMNGVEACQYSQWSLVEPGNPEESWLMVKLVHEFDADGNIVGFTADPSWDPGIAPDESGSYPPSSCPLTVSGEISFGSNMPQIRGNPMPLNDEEIDVVRRWILAGAPGPSAG